VTGITIIAADGHAISPTGRSRQLTKTTPNPNAAARLRILIVDDHPIIRRGMRQILAEEWPEATFSEATNGWEALALAQAGDCEVVLLDLTLPGLDGLDVLERLKQTRPRLPVLVLTMHPEDEFGLQALRAGAAGYLTKETAPLQLAQAVRKVLAGGSYITPVLAEKLAEEFQTGKSRLPHELLSRREFQVLCRLAAGQTIKEIAFDLSRSAKTISTYRTRLLRKMKLRNTAELIRYGIEHKLEQPRLASAPLSRLPSRRPPPPVAGHPAVPPPSGNILTSR
jgi:DNA-binding NarL/FixJ family response regulator